VLPVKYSVQNTRRELTSPLTFDCDNFVVTGRYYEMIEDETLPPDMILDLVPLCMDSVRYMLGSCRVPGLHADTLTVASSSRHVVVVRYIRLTL